MKPTEALQIIKRENLTNEVAIRETTKAETLTPSSIETTYACEKCGTRYLVNWQERTIKRIENSEIG
jgi:DNA-directed RNA polymerase subunit RPC12/RpoP